MPCKFHRIEIESKLAMICPRLGAFTIETIFYTNIIKELAMQNLYNLAQLYCFVNVAYVGYLLPSSCVGISKQTKQKN